MKRNQQLIQLVMAIVMVAGMLSPAAAAKQPTTVNRLQPILLDIAAESPDDFVRVIVQKDGDTDQPEHVTETLGGTLLHDLYFINAFTAELPASALDKLAKTSGVGYVSLDAPMVPSAVSATQTLLDKFGAVSFSNNDGDSSFSGAWVEVGEADGPSEGDLRIKDQRLLIKDDGREIYRTADLSTANSATLTFDYRRVSFDKTKDYVALVVSVDGGANWVELDRFTGPANEDVLQPAKHDLGEYLTVDTLVGFQTSASLGNRDKFLVDNFQITYTVETQDTADEPPNSDPGDDYISKLFSFVSPDCLGAECFELDNLQSTFLQAIGADRLWTETPAIMGEGVTVAVVDTGITPHEDFKEDYNLISKYRIVGSTDITSDSSFSWDGYGHGTHIAGLIGGNGYKSNSMYMGVAPQVNLVNVRVSNEKGVATASDAVAGLQWVYENKDKYNIRAVNLSLQSSVPESYDTSPLNVAVEILWLNDVVVIVAAGNERTPDGDLYPPANDPYVITVGATDPAGTADLSDDFLASYSAYGRSEMGPAKPDLVAPGVDTIAPMCGFDCVAYIEHPTHRLEGDTFGWDMYFRMSGTSMAAGVTTGAVALLLQDEPGLTADQVKYRLMSTARSFDGPEPGSTGAGLLDIYAAVHDTSTEAANQNVIPHQLLAKMALVAYWASENGGEDIDWGAIDWEAVNWTTVDWEAVNWAAVNWTAVNWTAVNWTAVNWTAVNWTAVNWTAVNWTAVNWTAVNWTAVNWTAVNWTD